MKTVTYRLYLELGNPQDGLVAAGWFVSLLYQLSANELNGKPVTLEQAQSLAAQFEAGPGLLSMKLKYLHTAEGG